MKSIRYFTLFFAAFLGSMIGMIILIPFGLLVQKSIILPIIMLVAAIPAALAAGWVGNALDLHGQQTQLKTMVLSVEKTAVFLAIYQFLDATFYLFRLSPPALMALAASVVLALSSVIAAVRYRQQESSIRQDVKLTLKLLAIIPIVPCVILFATWLGLTSA